MLNFAVAATRCVMRARTYNIIKTKKNIKK